MSLRSMVIVNPSSGGGATGRAWPTLRQGLETTLGTWDEVFTSGPNEATRLARQAIRADYEQLVVVGGDGTLNEAVNGLFEVDPGGGGIERQPIKHTILAPVRRGTGGDFARLLELPGRGSGVFRHLGSERTRPMDLGICRFRGPEGRQTLRAFANVAGFGLSPRVMIKVNASSKALGQASFATATASALLQYRRRPVRVRVDGSVIHEGPLVQGVVANGAYFGGGLRIAPDASIDDGLLDVVLLLESGPREVLRVLDVFSGRHTQWGSARVARGRVVEAEVLDDEGCLLELDGELPGALDARFEVIPGAVSLRGA